MIFKNKIERSLYRTVNQFSLPSFEEISDISVVKMAEHDNITWQRGSEKKRSFKTALKLSIACIALLFVLTVSWYQLSCVAYSTVTLDVNPSIGITVNRLQRVVSVQNFNADAQSLLTEQDYRGQSIEKTVKSLMLRLTEAGFLDKDHHTVLISIQNKHQSYAQRMEKTLSGCIQSVLKSQNIEPFIISQFLSSDIENQDDVQRFGISQGKLQFIKEILRNNKQYTLEQLANMSMEELSHIEDAMDEELSDTDIDDDDDDVDDDDDDDSSDENIGDSEEKDDETDISMPRDEDSNFEAQSNTDEIEDDSYDEDIADTEIEEDEEEDED